MTALWSLREPFDDCKNPITVNLDRSWMTQYRVFRHCTLRRGRPGTVTPI
jgi:hypothetical protein